MTIDQITKCNAIIHSASLGAGLASAVTLPVVDAVPISGAQVTMAITLGKVFDQELTESTAKGIVGAAASTLIGRSVVKLIPIAGQLISAVVASGITEALGWTIAVDFAKSYRLKYKYLKTAKDAADARAEIHYYKEQAQQNDEEAEDFSDGE